MKFINNFKFFSPHIRTKREQNKNGFQFFKQTVESVSHSFIGSFHALAFYPIREIEKSKKGEKQKQYHFVC